LIFLICNLLIQRRNTDFQFFGYAISFSFAS